MDWGPWSEIHDRTVRKEHQCYQVFLTSVSKGSIEVSIRNHSAITSRPRALLHGPSLIGIAYAFVTRFERVVVGNVAEASLLLVFGEIA